MILLNMIIYRKECKQTICNNCSILAMFNVNRAILLFFFVSICFNAHSQSLQIDIADIKQGKGDIKLALFNQPGGFPFETGKACKLLKGKAVNGKINFIIDSLSAGRYAIALFHDINNDGILNLNMLGIPKEGYGVSNNAYNTFSAPKYDDASFVHTKTTIQKITMKY